MKYDPEVERLIDQMRDLLGPFMVSRIVMRVDMTQSAAALRKSFLAAATELGARVPAARSTRRNGGR